MLLNATMFENISILPYDETYEDHYLKIMFKEKINCIFLSHLLKIVAAKSVRKTRSKKRG